MSKLDLSQRIITQDVDLTQLPIPISDEAFAALLSASHGKTVLTLPDMHGNGFKLLYYLLWLGLIRFKKDADAEAILSELFQIHLKLWDRDTYDETDAAQTLLNAWAESIRRNFMATERTSNVLVRCIGDVFGDRGPNDVITKDVLYTMKHSWRIPYDLFYGNHDHEIQCWLEDETLRPGTDLRQQGSLTRAKKCVKSGILTREDFKKSIHDVVTPHWKLFDIDIIDDSHWYMFGHSIALIPAIFSAAKDLAIPLGFTINTCTKEELIRLVNSVNQRFSELATKEQLTQAGQPADPDGITYAQSLAHSLLTNNGHFSLNECCIPSDKPIAYITSTRDVIHDDFTAHQSCCERLGIQVTTVSGHLGHAAEPKLFRSKLIRDYLNGAELSYCDYFNKIDNPIDPPTPLPNHINLDADNLLGRPSPDKDSEHKGKAIVFSSPAEKWTQILTIDDQTQSEDLQKKLKNLDRLRKDNKEIFQSIVTLNEANHYLHRNYTRDIQEKRDSLNIPLQTKRIRITRYSSFACLAASGILSLAAITSNLTNLTITTTNLTSLNIGLGVSIGILVFTFVACLLYSVLTKQSLNHKRQHLNKLDAMKSQTLRANAGLWNRYLTEISINERARVSLTKRTPAKYSTS